MNTDVPVLQLGGPMPCLNSYLIDPFIPKSTFDVYVPFEYSTVAHVTSTQEGAAAHHNAFEPPPYQSLSARAPNAPYLLLPVNPPSPYRIQSPSESMIPPLRPHVGSPALASAKRKIRTHEAKFFCDIAGCGHDFTTKQNLKSMFNIITVFSFFV